MRIIKNLKRLELTSLEVMNLTKKTKENKKMPISQGKRSNQTIITKNSLLKELNLEKHPNLKKQILRQTRISTPNSSNTMNFSKPTPRSNLLSQSKNSKRNLALSLMNSFGHYGRFTSLEDNTKKDRKMEICSIMNFFYQHRIYQRIN